MTLHPGRTGRLIWSDIHIGVFAIMPGTASGSQTIEALHRSWAARLPRRGILPNMEVAIFMIHAMYDEWALGLELDRDYPTSLVPRAADPRMLRPNGLSHVQGSTAYDFARSAAQANHVIVGLPSQHTSCSPPRRRCAWPQQRFSPPLVAQLRGGGSDVAAPRSLCHLCSAPHGRGPLR